MSTLTASLAQSEPRTLHAGMNVARSGVADTTTRTAASTFLLAKVPHGAAIVDFMFYVDDGAGASQTWQLGIQYPTDKAASASALLAVTSTTGITHMRGVNGATTLPFGVSWTDSTVEQFAWVTANNGVATSASCDIRFTLFYHLD